MAAPTVTDVNPAAASTIDDDEALAFTVNGADLRTIVAVQFESLVFTELAHDGDSFTTRYAELSTLTDLGGGSFRYSLRRDPIWPASPKLRIFAFTTTGEEL